MLLLSVKYVGLAVKYVRPVFTVKLVHTSLLYLHTNKTNTIELAGDVYLFVTFIQ